MIIYNYTRIYSTLAGLAEALKQQYIAVHPFAPLLEHGSSYVDNSVCYLLNAHIFDYYESSSFGFKTLERSYLLRMDGRIAERPQHLRSEHVSRRRDRNENVVREYCSFKAYVI
jgi:hypothetical protein